MGINIKAGSISITESKGVVKVNGKKVYPVSGDGGGLLDLTVGLIVLVFSIGLILGGAFLSLLFMRYC